MRSFLYITEIFCPWCYGFAPVVERIVQEYALPAKVICGCLNENRISLAVLARKMPNARDFFARLSETTGQKISEKYLSALFGDDNDKIYMDSARGGHIFYALKSLAAGRDLGIMTALEKSVYGEGRDVLAQETVHGIAQNFGMDLAELDARLESSDYAAKAEAEVEEGFDVMGDIVLYPCLYLISDGEAPQLVARGFTPYEQVKEKLDALLGTAAPAQELAQGHVCSPDGYCTF